MFKRSLLLALAVTLVTTGAVSAATWYGDYDNDYMNPLNWEAYTVPAVWEAVTVKALPVGTASNECTVSTIVAGSAGAVVIQNGGVLNLQSPANGTGIIAGYQFNGSSYINNGTLNTYFPTTATNALRSTSNIYVGTSNGLTGTMNVYGGVTIKGGATLTLGGSGGNGIINLHGHIDLNLMRWRYQGGTAKMNLYEGCEFWFGSATDYSPTLNAEIAAGNIVSMVPGYVPVVDFNSVDARTLMTLGRGYKATLPSPANNSTIAGMSAPSQAITLSWTKPLPEDVNKPVTSDIYISTDPDMLVGVTTLDTGIAGNSVSATVDKLQAYYWRVDSTDPNKAVPLTAGDVWTFNTNNTAPAVAISAPYLTTAPDVALWLPGNTSATISSVITDDGYPIGGSTSYLWERQNLDTTADPNWYTASTAATCTTPTYSTVTGTDYDNYNYRLTYDDGELATTRSFLVRVFRTTCIAAPRLPGYVSLTGEFSGDCKVSFVDFATFAQNWGLCNAVGEVCN
jgi:hypothetical protein